ncbi:MAG: hypothetical protein H6541_13025 [Lentimicrobiaceae bacterium]|nr:hypothetical protein [Lentimicrobiaceae bacterium]MCB9024309.1 hypothetical protein [Lentimicrobiaceae bacterium]
MNAHTFHIPVMGIGFTIDTPAKVAPLGISSVISLVDDMLMEKMREFHSRQMNLPFQSISSKIEDFRAKRITAFLDLMDKAVKEKFEELKDSWHKKEGDFEKYMDMLPDKSELKLKFQQFIQEHSPKSIRDWLNIHLPSGSIDVNIMTKLDKENYNEEGKLPVEYNDAHAALRGFANSTVNSSIVLSAGMNPRLYSYLEEFPGFYPDSKGLFSKKIILKVSDYRSALIQGKYLAKKGLWVSEYRIESGLNCGGHAFATQGHLMGPILEDFKQNRAMLVEESFQLYAQALKNKNKPCPASPPEMRVTAQGGVGTAGEHQFLLEHYALDSVGWGSPFLLVPEVANIDDTTLQLLIDAKEDDLYLSNISPLGVPFNNLRGNSKDIEKEIHIATGKPGSACSKKYASLNSEFTEKPVCTASRQFQRLKIEELNHKQLSADEYNRAYKSITDKSCICVGLGTSALLVNNIETVTEGEGVSVCPGPNLAWFNQKTTLRGMAEHIYGRKNLIKRPGRPHMFLNELKMYIDYLENKIKETVHPVPAKQQEYFNAFGLNLHNGIEYYQKLYQSWSKKYKSENLSFPDALQSLRKRLDNLTRPANQFTPLPISTSKVNTSL